MTFSINENIKATWPDGLVVVGKYKASLRGYVILIDNNNQEVACCKHTTKFEKMHQEK